MTNPDNCIMTGAIEVARAAGRALNTVAHPKGASNLLAGSIHISLSPMNAAPIQYKQVLLFFADVYGPFFINNGLLQDYFASRGFIVLGPDYFLGKPVQSLPPDRDRVAWSVEARAVAIEAFTKWFEQVKATYGTQTTKYTAVGYCFGAPFVLDLAAEGSLITGAIAHPGFLEESHFQKLKRPLLLSCAENDFTFPLEARRRAEDILVGNKSTYFFQVSSGVSHRFAIRGDPNVPHERWAKEESARGITEWFFHFVAEKE